MLTPEEIEDIRYAAGHLLDDTIEMLYNNIITLIKRSGHVPDVAAYNLLLLSYLGENNKIIYKKISDSLKTSESAVEKLITDSVSRTYRDDIKRITGKDVEIGKKRLKRLTKGMIKACAGNIANLTRTMGFITASGTFSPLTDVYKQVSGEAFKAVATGALSYDEAILKAAESLIASGVKTIDYASGAVVDVKAAIRRNVMGAIGELTNRVAEQNFEELGCDGWEISAHMACAPDHEWIQGRQFKAKEWEKLDAGLKRHIGTLNCGHIKFPIIIGKSKPVHDKTTLEQYKADNKKGVYYSGKHYTIYEATQKQRAIERAIRKNRERLSAYEALGPAGADKVRTLRLKNRQFTQLYNNFCRETGLKVQYNRLK